MPGEFLGVGLSFPVEPKDGELALTRHEEGIRQSIWIILATAKGERVMRPDFGCGIHDLVFATLGAGTAGRLASEVRDALVRWEPRIDVLDVRVTAGRDEPNLVLIHIEYRVRTTDNSFNLVYPFYLERGAV